MFVCGLAGTSPTAAAVAPAFVCWDGARKRTLKRCGEPRGVAGLNWALPGVGLTSTSCSPQGEDHYARCSFADVGIEPVPGVADVDQLPRLGGGLTIAASRTFACTYECRDWVIDGELAGRLEPRPPSQMRGVPVVDGSATACWNGTSAAGPESCPKVGGRAGLLWSFPGLRGRLLRCEDHGGDLERLWICDYSDLGLTDVPGAGEWPHQLYVRFTTGQTGAQQILDTRPPVGTHDVQDWRIDGEVVGTLVRSTEKSPGGRPIFSVDAGYADAPFWFEVAGRSEAEVAAVVELLHPRAILTDRG